MVETEGGRHIHCSQNCFKIKYLDDMQLLKILSRLQT